MSEQPRVVAEDELGLHISIPKDCPHLFNVLPSSEHANNSYTIEEILAAFSLPRKIQLVKDDGMFITVDGQKKHEYPFGVLKLLKTHKVSYLVCNSLTPTGVTRQPVILPMYITIEVVVGEGLVTGTKKQWEEYQRLRTQAVESHMNLEEVKGNEGISIYDAADVHVKRKANVKEETIYEEIEPKILRISSLRGTSGGITGGIDYSDSTATYEDIIEVKDIFRAEVKEGMPTPSIPPEDKTLPAPGTYMRVVSELGQYEKPSRTAFRSSTGERHLASSGEDARKSSAIPHTKSMSLPPDKSYVFLRPRPAVPAETTTTKPAIPVKPVVGFKGRAMDQKTTELPDKVDGLSVLEVCNCLKTLNMSKYVNNFEENDIDGNLLCGLTADIMQSDLGMTKLHAIKLEKFINGWRPQYK
ncbi:uncharacterized protein [Ptychodera flava]